MEVDVMWTCLLSQVLRLLVKHQCASQEAKSNALLIAQQSFNLLRVADFGCFISCSPLLAASPCKLPSAPPTFGCGSCKDRVTAFPLNWTGIS